MINFKNKDEAAPSAVILLSLVVLLATLVIMVFIRKPDVAHLAAGKERDERQIKQQIDSAKDETAKSEAKSEPQLWEGDPQSIMARALSRLADGAERQHIQMSSFRPQKQAPNSGAIEMPFSIQLAGPYPAVRAYLSALDTPSSAIALRSVSLSSADGATDAVSANVGLSVYCRDASVVPAPADDTAEPAAKSTAKPAAKPVAKPAAKPAPAAKSKTTGATAGG